MSDTHDPTQDIESVDPVVAAGFGLLSALAEETAALDVLLLRCRATMLLASAGELTHIGKASADVDEAAGALEIVSQRRIDMISTVERVWGVSIGSARDLVETAPDEFRNEIEHQLMLQRELLQETTEAVEVARVLSERSLESLQRRRSELEVSGQPLTYGAQNAVPPTAIQQFA